MRRMSLVLLFLMITGLITGNRGFASEKKLKLQYEVDVTKLEEDSFHVSLNVGGYAKDSAVFQFAATAPGTYQTMDVGRFVGSFAASNASGVKLPVYRLSTNQFVIRNAQTLTKITYKVEDTYDTKIAEFPVYPMSGSSLEKDNALINGQMVFGYLKGYQSNPVQVTYNYPKDWKIATALGSKNGIFTASTFDQLVDSPVLFGNLTSSSTKVGGAKVDVICYSQSGDIHADSLLRHLKKMLDAADTFIGGLPVDRYVFLFKFNAEPMQIFGAWEHNYSSFYILPEGPQNGVVGQQLYSMVSNVAAHEFFHIVTPLNIHSEYIEPFNFEKPNPSRHLWLYEGCTEWAAQMMEVRSGIVDENAFTKRMSQKMQFSDQFNPNVSLVDLALGSYGDLRNDYINIYQKGALTAMMLDMRLLELSKGKTGLREVIRKLSKKYGPNKTFPEDKFFDIFVEMTYPEVGEFFDKYIKGTERLPIKEYLAKAGFDYETEFRSGKFMSTRGLLGLNFVDGKIMVTDADSTNEINRQTGIQKGDELIALVWNGKEKPLTDPEYHAMKNAMQPGEEFAWKVKRDGQEMLLKGIAGKTEVVEKHAIKPMAAPTKEQLAFKTWWLTNR